MFRHESQQIPYFPQDRGAGQLHRRGAGAELHPVRHQPRHRLAGGGAGRDAAGTQSRRRDAYGGRAGSDAVFSGDVRHAAPDGAARRRPAGSGYRSGAGGDVHQRVGEVAAGDTQDVPSQVPPDRVRASALQLQQRDLRLGAPRAGGLRVHLPAHAGGEVSGLLAFAAGPVEGHHALRPPHGGAGASAAGDAGAVSAHSAGRGRRLRDTGHLRPLQGAAQDPVHRAAGSDHFGDGVRRAGHQHHGGADAL